MKIVILCLLVARTCLGQQYDLTIQEFEEKFTKTYGSPEEEAAAAINLAAHVAKINAQNEKYANGDATYGEAVYAWDDLSEEELSNTMTGLTHPPDLERVNTPEVLAHFDNLRKMYNRQELPEFWDSRNKTLTNSSNGWITSVKNQGSCGSCVAFANNAAAEAALIKAGADFDSMDISEQWLLNCSPKGSGCNGAWTYADWIPTQGVLVHEDDYPYTATSNKKNCKDGPYWNPGYKIDNFLGGFDCSDEQIMMQIREYGSASIGVYVSGGFYDYKEGVYDDCPSGKWANHEVLAIGWGKLNGIDYWLIKNSWGSWWGENGYIKIKRGTCSANESCYVLTTAKSTVCSKDSPCETGMGHCKTNDECQSGICGSKNCPANESCEKCHNISPVANCCKEGTKTCENKWKQKYCQRIKWKCKWNEKVKEKCKETCGLC